MYAPHILQVRRKEIIRDKLNRTVGEELVWVDVGPCRCDDNTTARITDVNGKAFVPAYHIVVSRCDLKAGDYVRAMSGDTVRGEGEIKRIINTNYLDYGSIYV